MLRVRERPGRGVAPTPEERLEQLDSVVRSRVFHDSEILVTLLRYLARHSDEEPGRPVKEYAIALDVFGRDSEFNPRTNSIVRVQAKNLRNKLQAYYETEGRADRVRIEIPKGHYEVIYSYAEPDGDAPAVEDAPAAGPAPETRADGPRPPRRAAFGARAAIAAASLAAVAILLALAAGDRREQPPAPANDAAATEGAAVWGPFLRPDVPTLLILSNPPVYRFLNNSDSKSVSEHSIEVPPEKAAALAKELEDKLVMRQGRAPRLVLSTSSYTGMGEAIGLHRLTDLFRSLGRGLEVKQSRTVGADDVKNHNVILLGSAWVNDWVEKLPVEEDFVFSVDASIENRAPLTGEEREYKPRYDEATGRVEEDYALITVKPGITEEYRLMTLAGVLSEGTQAAAEYVTRREYLLELDRRLRQLAGEDGPPKYYQVLLKVGVDNGIPTTVSVLAVHPLEVTRE